MRYFIPLVALIFGLVELDNYNPIVDNNNKILFQLTLVKVENYFDEGECHLIGSNWWLEKIKTKEKIDFLQKNQIGCFEPPKSFTKSFLLLQSDDLEYHFNIGGNRYRNPVKILDIKDAFRLQYDEIFSWIHPKSPKHIFTMRLLVKRMIRPVEISYSFKIEAGTRIIATQAKSWVYKIDHLNANVVLNENYDISKYEVLPDIYTVCIIGMVCWNSAIKNLDLKIRRQTFKFEDLANRNQKYYQFFLDIDTGSKITFKSEKDHQYPVVKIATQPDTECSSDFCNNNGKCRFNEEWNKIRAPYKCECDSGYTGYSCEIQSFCLFCDASKTSTAEHKCLKGWTGDKCDQREPQDLDVCQNGGTASIISEYQIFCVCETPFVGKYCESMIKISADPDINKKDTPRSSGTSVISEENNLEENSDKKNIHSKDSPAEMFPLEEPMTGDEKVAEDLEPIADKEKALEDMVKKNQPEEHVPKFNSDDDLQKKDHQETEELVEIFETINRGDEIITLKDKKPLNLDEEENLSSEKREVKKPLVSSSVSRTSRLVGNQKVENQVNKPNSAPQEQNKLSTTLYMVMILVAGCFLGSVTAYLYINQNIFVSA